MTRRPPTTAQRAIRQFLCLLAPAHWPQVWTSVKPFWGPATQSKGVRALDGPRLFAWMAKVPALAKHARHGTVVCLTSAPLVDDTTSHRLPARPPIAAAIISHEVSKLAHNGMLLRFNFFERHACSETQSALQCCPASVHLSSFSQIKLARS